jgi:hypothetical protein
MANAEIPSYSEDERRHSAASNAAAAGLANEDDAAVLGSCGKT